MNPVPTKNHGLTVAASTLHAINNTPTVIMTWRMMGSGALLSVTVGRPARSHAMMPPSITETLVRPALRNSVATWFARPPDRHRMSSCWLAGDSGNDVARNDELGRRRVLGTCWRRCSSGSRTSMMLASPACTRRAASLGVMVGAQAAGFALGMAVLVVMVGMSRVTGRWFPEMWELPWWGAGDPLNHMNPLRACHAAGSIRLTHGSKVRTTGRSSAGDRGACDSLRAHVARGGVAFNA